MDAAPRVTYITPVFNGADTLERTINSVLEQDYPDIEYIVMDGGSSDGTVEILRKYGERLRWYSEPDKGQTDAINKGAVRSSGAYLNWICDDDYLYPNAVRLLVQALQENPQAGLAYGLLDLVDHHGKFIRAAPRIRAGTYAELLHLDNIVGQPQCLFTRQAWEQCGPLSLNYDYCMDWDLFIKIGAKFPIAFVPKSLAAFAQYEGTKTVSGGLPRFEEILRMLDSHGSRGTRYILKTGIWHYEHDDMRTARLYFWKALRRRPRAADRWQLVTLILKTYLGSKLVLAGRELRKKVS